jgi:cyclopropane fatty-acyl-phospholipid synthase-like methyltransferase
MLTCVSEAAERNKGPILAVLRAQFATARQVLEVGSGTGQHAVYFARELPHLIWQPSELPAQLPALAERLQAESSPNLRTPLPLDAATYPWPGGPVDAVYSANTLHIMSWAAVEQFFRGVGSVLSEPGVLCVYGPFSYGGRHTSPSNLEFDRFLKARDVASGIRDFAEVDALARAVGLSCSADHAMPANNRTLVWRRG